MQIELREDGPIVLGRESAEGFAESVVLDSKSVSRKHCQIQFERGRFRIKDLNSSNGIRVNRQKVLDGYLNAGDTLQVGEFVFVVEKDVHSTATFGTSADSSQQEETPIHLRESHKSRPGTHLTGSQTRPALALRLKEKGQQLWKKFNRLDFIVRTAVILAVGALLSHSILSFALIQESRNQLVDQSIDLGFQAIKSMVDRNRNSLAADSAVSLDCTSVRDIPGVVRAYVLNRDGATVCPVGGPALNDGLFQLVSERQDTSTNGCLNRILNLGLDYCEIMGPVFDWDQTKQSPQIGGYVRVEFSPQRALMAVQDLQSVSSKVLILFLVLMAAIWWILGLWVKAGVAMGVENVHVVTSGSSQRIEKIEFFASLDPLIEEMNQQIAKSLQGLSSSSGNSESEASFLQSFLQQILLLEERAILVVDHENQFMAASAALATVIPIDVSRDKAHIAEIVADTHLQGELMSFLNELSSSDSVVDRALSMSDRVLQVRGMPLFLKGQHVASLLLF